MSMTSGYDIDDDDLPFEGVRVRDDKYFRYGAYVTSPHYPLAVGTVRKSDVEMEIRDLKGRETVIHVELDRDLPEKPPRNLYYDVVVDFVWGRRALDGYPVAIRATVSSKTLTRITEEQFKAVAEKPATLPDLTAVAGRRDRVNKVVTEAAFIAEQAFMEAFEPARIRKQVAENARSLIAQCVAAQFGLNGYGNFSEADLQKTATGQQIGAVFSGLAKELLEENIAEIKEVARRNVQAQIIQSLKKQEMDYTARETVNTALKAVDAEVLKEFLPTMTEAYRKRLDEILLATKTQDVLASVVADEK